MTLGWSDLILESPLWKHHSRNLCSEEPCFAKETPTRVLMYYFPQKAGTVGRGLMFITVSLWPSDARGQSLRALGPLGSGVWYPFHRQRPASPLVGPALTCLHVSSPGSPNRASCWHLGQNMSKDKMPVTVPLEGISQISQCRITGGWREGFSMPGAETGSGVTVGH